MALLNEGALKLAKILKNTVEQMEKRKDTIFNVREPRIAISRCEEMRQLLFFSHKIHNHTNSHLKGNSKPVMCNHRNPPTRKTGKCCLLLRTSILLLRVLDRKDFLAKLEIYFLGM